MDEILLEGDALAGGSSPEPGLDQIRTEGLAIEEPVAETVASAPPENLEHPEEGDQPRL